LVALEWGAFFLFIANFFATQNIGGAKELIVLFVIKWQHLIYLNNELKE